tara:strand:+ start:564 stop:2420 length:1857 start_codon:yes stop_codon:yes gene_type:complete
MATTYTDNTGITKPGSGEQSGTWGTTVNTNFDIIDRALNDVGAITLSGSTYTLTTNNGSLSDGQYSAIVFSGTLSGDCTVTIDPSDAAKTYIVKNSTTGGFSVIFSQGNGSGGTLTVPADQVAIVYADGAGVGAKVDGKALSNVTDALTFSGTTKVQATSTGATVTGNLINDGVEVLTGGYLNGAPGSTLSLEGFFNNGTENIAIGSLALGGTASPNSMSGNGKNTAIGKSAAGALTSGDYNTAIGYSSSEGMVSGSENTSVGLESLKLNQSGNKNVAVGSNALFDNVLGSENVALGYKSSENSLSSYNVVIGSQANTKDALASTLGAVGENIAIGYQAGAQTGSGNATGYLSDANSYKRNITVGTESGKFLGGYSSQNVFLGYRAGPQVAASDQSDDNVGIGTNALYRLTTADSNVCIGEEAGSYITAGGYNVCIGPDSGVTNTADLTGSFNVAVGWLSTLSPGGASNTVIGRGAGSSTSPFNMISGGPHSDRIVLGDNSITNAYINVAWTVTSDVRDKTNIENVDLGLEFLSSFTPIKFRYTNSREENDPHGPQHYGYSAQDVLAAEGANPVIIDTEQPEKLKLKETQLIPVLHNAILELKEENAALRARLDAAGI